MNALVALGQKYQQQKNKQKKRVIQTSITCKVLYNANELMAMYYENTQDMNLLYDIRNHKLN